MNDHCRQRFYAREAIMLDPALRLAALGVMLVPVPAPTNKHEFYVLPPRQSVRADADSLLVATLENGEIQSHWLPQLICERIVSQLHAGRKISAISFDGTVANIEKANCSLRNSQLNFPPPSNDHLSHALSASDAR
jgi:hypothetical protein